MSYNGHLTSRATSVKLVLSDNTAVEALLTNIPLFCIGILAFGISTFFLFMRRINLLAVYLYSSAFLAFGAAILDLSQIVGRNGQLIDQDAVNGLVNTREIGLGLSIGFRFLFYWAFIAQRPRGEPPPPSPEDIRERYNVRDHAHSADWRRWGFFGFILRWALLLVTLAIPVLQIIWRIVSRRSDIVYTVETTLEIVASSIFILKIFLNIFLSSVTPWWKLTLWYLVPVVALSINLAVAAGNLSIFLFSEMTFGRFLQAIQLYLLIIFLLVSEFRKSSRVDQQTSSNMARQLKAGSSFVNFPTDSFDQKPSSSNVFAGRGATQLQRSQPAGASSMSNRIPPPTRLSWAKSLGRRASQGWGRGDIEEGGVAPATAPPVSGAFETSSLPTPSYPEEFSAPPPMRQTQGVSFSSYYEQARPETMTLQPPRVNAFTTAPGRQGTESPIYGLNGIVKGAASARGSVVSMSSFDELMKQQKELDKSIAALRIFSPEPPEPKTAPAPATEESLLTTSRRPSKATNSWGRVDSVSARSEFSLSVFPAPPTQAADSPLPSPLGLGRVIRADSNATQYEITSFIGDLTAPTPTTGTYRPRSTLHPSNGFVHGLSDVESAEDSEEDTMSPPVISKARAILVAGVPTATSTPLLGPATASSGLLTGPPSNTARLIQTPRTYNAPAVPSPLAGSFPVIRNPNTIPVGPRRPAHGRSTSNPMKLTISGPRPLGSDPVASAFEKPRAPPLFLNRRPGERG